MVRHDYDVFGGNDPTSGNKMKIESRSIGIISGGSTWRTIASAGSEIHHLSRTPDHRGRLDRDHILHLPLARFRHGILQRHWLHPGRSQPPSCPKPQSSRRTALPLSHLALGSRCLEGQYLETPLSLVLMARPATKSDTAIPRGAGLRRKASRDLVAAAAGRSPDVAGRRVLAPGRRGCEHGTRAGKRERKEL